MVVPLIRRLTLGIALAGTVAGASQPPDLRTRAETSDYAETSRYDDVMRVTRGIAESRALARVETFGRSEEGRELPLLVLANPAIASPDAARRLKRPIVFIQANIHGGEVEGKEASLQLARRLTTGDLQPLLGDLVVLIAPIYNADGNERISLEHRTAQNGPDRRRRHARERQRPGPQPRLHEAGFGRSARARRTARALGPACRHRLAHDQRLVSRLPSDLLADAQSQRRSAV